MDAADRAMIRAHDQALAEARAAFEALGAIVEDISDPSCDLIITLDGEEYTARASDWRDLYADLETP